MTTRYTDEELETLTESEYVAEMARRAGKVSAYIAGDRSAQTFEDADDLDLYARRAAIREAGDDC